MADDWGVVNEVPLSATNRLYVTPFKPTKQVNPPSDAGWKPVATAPASDWTPVATTPAQPAAKPAAPGLIEQAVEPFTSYPSTYNRVRTEAQGRMAEGAKEFGEGSRLKGAFKMGTGAVGYVTSPIEAGIESIAGRPIERATGIPKDYTDFAVGLAIPGYGLTKIKAGQEAITAARNAGKVIEKIASPETVDAEAKAAAATIREQGGIAARDTAQTSAALEPAWKKVNAMPDADRLDFVSYVEGRSGQYAGPQMRDPALQDLADTMRSAFEKRMQKIQNLPAHQQQAFIDDYFPHFWKDPGKATQAVQQAGGMAKQGSGASLKQRSVPTIADGIAMGLEPVTTNPLEATMRYVTSMDRFIAAEEVMQAAKDAGQVRFIKPKVMGASGHPSSFKVPDGWVKLEGRGATRGDGSQAYAPEGFARVYNNYISRGFAGIGQGEYGSAYDAFRLTSNAITGMELGLSGYHFLTVAKAALDNSMAQAIQLLRKGKPVAAAVQALKTPAAPFRYARSGKQVKDVYLGISQGSRELQETVDKLTRAGGRAVGGRTHAPEYEFSKDGSYVTALKRGALRIQLAADRAEAMGSPIGAAKVGARHLGRIMDTIAAPLFEQYIPAVKNGAFRENLGTWLKTHPQATQEEQLNAARQIWDTIDDRFGEMVQDNIFMNKLLKQVGMLGLRSWSWTVGQDVRMLGGATRDVLRAPFKTVGGIGPNDERWTQKMDMAIAMPIVYGTIAAIYQMLKTGQGPQDIHDLVAPRTGGTDASTGEPERLLLPGPEKDVFGFAMHGEQELENKKSKLMSEVGIPGLAPGHLMTNKDWRGADLFSGAEDAPPWLEQFWKYLGENALPISVQGLVKGHKQGSNLNAIENMLGVRNAPAYLTSKEAYDDMMERMREGGYRKKQRYEERQRGLYEGD
ncbi:MAG: hypothetical protein KGL35_24845 [Bradyrhizobium sp.]|nr:hypothetical protein [Bradyrhizobium sp.]